MRTAMVFVPMPYGAEEIMTTVEASVHRGLPEFRIVGMPDRSLREAAVRVKSAILVSGFTFPLGRVIVNIGPASIPKTGTRFDLAIAVSILLANAKLSRPCICVGELSLDGSVLPTRLLGVYDKPWIANAIEPVGSGSVVTKLRDAWSAIHLSEWETYGEVVNRRSRIGGYAIDSIRGNSTAKRALLIALTGRHNLLLSGPPGSGKTMLAEAAAALLPAPSTQEERRIRIVHSQAGIEYAGEYAPYQNPHHQVSVRQLLGQRYPMVPGHMSLASGGVLFLDELPYMRPEVLHALREPMQSGIVHLGAHGEVALPANPIVVAARNLCGCGKQGQPGQVCICTAHQKLQYEKRLDAALLDRFALSASMSYQDSKPEMCAEQYAEIIARVHQQKMTVIWPAEAEQLLHHSVQALKVSFRGADQIRSVSETIARVEGAQEVMPEHVRESMQYRVRKV